MIDPVQAIVGIVVLLLTVGALLFLFYSRTNAVEKTGYGTLIMLIIVTLMIPVFWIMETNGQTEAKVKLHNTAVERGAALYATLCYSCHGVNGQGVIGPKLNGNPTVSKLSDAELLRIIRGGDFPNPDSPNPNAMPAWSDQYGGPLSEPQIQYLFALIRSADPEYLAKNGFPTGNDANGFNKVPEQLQSSNPTGYSTAVAQATAGSAPAKLPDAVDMTAQSAITIDMANPTSGQTCTPACYSPQHVKVKVGTKITWVNKSSTPHTVTAIQGTDPSKLVANPAVFDSGATTLILANGTFEYTVTEAAYNANPDHTVLYYCSIHPTMLGMLTIVP